MNNNNKILLEVELFKEVISSIEAHIKENMTPQEKSFAMTMVFEQIQNSIKEFSKATGEKKEEIVEDLIELIIKKQKTTIFKEQYSLVYKMLNTIKDKKNEERN